MLRGTWLFVPLWLLATALLGEADAQTSFVPRQIGSAWTNAQIAESFASAPVQRPDDIRLLVIADPRGTEEEASCIRAEIFDVLREWLRFSRAPYRMVDAMADANVVMNFDTSDSAFEGKVRATVDKREARLASFMSSEETLVARQGEEIRRWHTSHPDDKTTFDLKRIHSAFYTTGLSPIVFSYVWYRSFSITGEYPRGGWPDAPYGLPAQSGGDCFGAHQRVAAFQRMLAHALGAAVYSRQHKLPSVEGLNSGVYDGRNTLLVRLLFHPAMEVGLSPEATRLRALDILNAARPNGGSQGNPR